MTQNREKAIQEMIEIAAKALRTCHFKDVLHTDSWDECRFKDTWRSRVSVGVQALYDVGYRLISDLPELTDEEKLVCSLVSRYPYEAVKDVIDETCQHLFDKLREHWGLK